MKKNIKTDHEINFIELLQIIWQGKWKMVVVAVISVLSTFIYQANQIKNFTAITTIVPISTFDMSKYSQPKNITTLYINKTFSINWNNKS